MDISEFENKFITEPNTGCWLWTGACRRDGYAVYKQTLGHIATYNAVKGPVLDGLEIDHKCRVRSCVNPDHLEAVTHLENVRRGAKGPKTHCKYGHVLDANNTTIDSFGRHCKTCARGNAQRQRERNCKHIMTDEVRAKLRTAYRARVAV